MDRKTRTEQPKHTPFTSRAIHDDETDDYETCSGRGMDLSLALQRLLKKALKYNGVACGLRECVKALDRRQAHLCILAGDCDSAEYVRLVVALAQEHSISLIKVPNGKVLGEWVGLAKLDRDGRPRKIVKCSCAVKQIRDWGEESPYKTFIKELVA